MHRAKQNGWTEYTKGAGSTLNDIAKKDKMQVQLTPILEYPFALPQSCSLRELISSSSSSMTKDWSHRP